MSEALTIDDCMSPGPYMINSNETCEAAQALMDDHSIRHLPVIEEGVLVGVVSMRDLQVLKTHCEIDAAKLSVRDVMTSDPYSVEIGTSLRAVAINMNARKYGCTVVKDGHKVVGLFTTVDAMRVLANLVE